MTRRLLFHRALGAWAGSSIRAWAQSVDSIRLRDLAARQNLLVGTAVSFAELHRPAFTELLRNEANIVVSENDMKWQTIHPEPNRFDFSRGDALMTFASQNGQQVRGHNLCWHKQLPAWFDGVATAQNAAQLLRLHIGIVAGHYAGRIQSWDVVNEAIEVKDGRPDGLRNSPWLRLIGPQYIEMAFRTAAIADPHALLTYNDYGLEQDGPTNQAKRDAVLHLLESLKNRGTPIHALGLQSHLQAKSRPGNWEGLSRFLDRVQQMGLDVFVTELDVNDANLPYDVRERDRRVAEMYGSYLSTVLQHPSVKAVLTWGLTDKDTWLNSFHPRADGQSQRSLPFDANLRPKPAFAAMRDAIGKAPPRSVPVRPSANVP